MFTTSKRLSRTLAIILATILLIGVIPAGAVSAAGSGAGNDSSNAVALPITGDTNPAATLTSEQAAAAAKGAVLASGTAKTDLTAIAGEEESLRTEETKYFRHTDGSYTAAMYAEPVHYLDENGKWQDIDNTLALDNSKRSEANKATFAPAASDFDIRVPQEFADNQKLTVEKDGHTIGLGVSPQNDAVQLSKKASVTDVEELTSEKLTEKPPRKSNLDRETIQKQN